MKICLYVLCLSSVFHPSNWLFRQRVRGVAFGERVGARGDGLCNSLMLFLSGRVGASGEGLVGGSCKSLMLFLSGRVGASGEGLVRGS
jgi:hypothetical protein